MFFPTGRILIPIPHWVASGETVQNAVQSNSVGNANFIGILAILLAIYFGINYGKRR